MTGSAPKTDATGGDVAAADAALAIAVWDLPIRLVHWSLVLLIAFSWWSAENEHVQWHFWSGYGILFLLLFRLLWGFLGSSTARFSAFVRGPRAILRYLRDPASWRGLGHTPFGALSVLALLGLIGLQVALGLLLSDEDGIFSAPLNRFVGFETAEAARELHEGVFNLLLGLILLHLAAIAVYRLRGKGLVRAMVTGRSRDIPQGAEEFVAGSPLRLAICLALAAAVTTWIASGVPGL